MQKIIQGPREIYFWIEKKAIKRKITNLKRKSRIFKRKIMAFKRKITHLKRKIRIFKRNSIGLDKKSGFLSDKSSF